MPFTAKLFQKNANVQKKRENETEFATGKTELKRVEYPMKRISSIKVASMEASETNGIE